MNIPFSGFRVVLRSSYEKEKKAKKRTKPPDTVFSLETDLKIARRVNSVFHTGDTILLKLSVTA